MDKQKICQRSIFPKSLADFPMDHEIEEKLNFENLGNTKCNQCQENQEDTQDKATKVFNECGFICSKCYDNHTSMKIPRGQKISSLRFERLPDVFKSALTEFMSCEQHRDKTIESFCKNCRKAVRENCIVESHWDCKSKICACTIDEEVEEIINNFQKRLFDNDLDVTRVEIICFEKLEEHQAKEDKRVGNINQLRQHCSATFIKSSDEAHVFKNAREKTKEELQMIKKRRIQRYLVGVSLLHNKVCILQYEFQKRESIQSLQNDVNMIQKVVCGPEDTTTDYHSFTVFVDISSQRYHHNEGMVHSEDNRHDRSSKAKYYNDEKRIELHRETSVARYQIKYKTSMFPRYKYHLELIQKIIDREREVDVTNNINDKSQQRQFKKETDEGLEQMEDISTLLQSNIFVYGRATNEIRKFLHPLELQEAVGNVQRFENDILVAFGDALDADSKTVFYNTIQEQMNKCCWCILVSSKTDTEKHMNSSSDLKFSIVLPDIDAVWNHLTSAMDLKLIKFLNAKSRNMEMPLSIREDVKTVLRRIEKCSAIKQNRESNRIPKSIQDVLKRFGKEIVQYGFNFKIFRVVVKNKRFAEVEKSLYATGLYNSFAVDVIYQDDFVEKIVPYNTQRMKLAVANIYDTFVL